MAGVLTVVAEEMGRVCGMVWSGVGVAVRLNNQVMTVIIKATTRIVQLLLLLTHKAADLLSILLTDLLVFLGDIGNAVFTVANGIKAGVELICSLVSSLFLGLLSAAAYSCHLVYSSYLALLTGVLTALTQVGSALTLLKHLFILFGSSVMFLISLLPNLVYLVFSGLVHLGWCAYLSCGDFACRAYLSVTYAKDMLVHGVLSFFCDIPLEAVVGVVVGMALLLGMKYTLFYMMENLVLVPDLPVLPSFLLVLRQRLIRWYAGVVRRAHQRPPVDEDTEEEELEEEDNDENGNDNNDNVPDLNLPQNQQPGPHIPVPPPLPGTASGSRGPIPLPPPLPGVANGSRGLIPLPLPLAGAASASQRPMVPLVQPRRPIREQPLAEEEAKSSSRQLDKQTAQETTKSRSSSNGRLDERTYQLYRELEQEREGQLCVVCQDQVKCVILLPCRHLCLCDACRSAIITRDNTCPVCRRIIMESLRVFV